MTLSGWVLVFVGLVVMGVGLWALRWAREAAEREGESERVGSESAGGPRGESGGEAGIRPGEGGGATSAAWARAKLRDASAATRITLAVGVLINGYHAVAWGLPPEWLTVRVPVESWWMVPVGAVALMALAWSMDRWERGVNGS
jgi:hypothetical protein